jgi:hypothetical protein
MVMTIEEYQKHTEDLIQVINANAKLRADIAATQARLAQLQYDLKVIQVMEAEAKIFAPHDN